MVSSNFAAIGFRRAQTRSWRADSTSEQLVAGEGGPQCCVRVSNIRSQRGGCGDRSFMPRESLRAGIFNESPVIDFSGMPDDPSRKPLAPLRLRGRRRSENSTPEDSLSFLRCQRHGDRVISFLMPDSRAHLEIPDLGFLGETVGARSPVAADGLVDGSLQSARTSRFRLYRNLDVSIDGAAENFWVQDAGWQSGSGWNS